MRPRTKGKDQGVVTWGWYAVTEGAAETTGGSTAGLIPRDRTEHAFWAAWWSEDPRLGTDVAPDAFGFYYGTRAHFFAGAEAESHIRRTKSPRAYVLSIAEPFARAAYREGAPRRRSEATDFEAVSDAWCDERGIPRTSIVEVVKKTWHDYLKSVHGGEGAVGVDLDLERKRYDAALATALARETGYRRAQQSADIAEGVRPVDHVANDRATVKRVKRIAGEVRERLEVVARHLEVGCAMAGLCHFAALGLVAALCAEGVAAVIATSGGHSWVDVFLEVGDRPLLVDVTATQYGLAPVYVRLPKQSRRHPYAATFARGNVAGTGAQSAADVDVELAPVAWWAMDVRELPKALRAAGTRLSAHGARLRRAGGEALLNGVQSDGETPSLVSSKRAVP